MDGQRETEITKPTFWAKKKDGKINN